MYYKHCRYSLQCYETYVININQPAGSIARAAKTSSDDEVTPPLFVAASLNTYTPLLSRMRRAYIVMVYMVMANMVMVLIVMTRHP